MLPEFYKTHLKNQLNLAEYILLKIMIILLQSLKKVSLEALATALPIPIEGATKELKRLLDKHYSPHTLPIKCHLIANQRHHFQDQFLTLIHRNYPTRTV